MTNETHPQSRAPRPQTAGTQAAPKDHAQSQAVTAEVAIVGGGTAGLAAAIALARSLRQVVVIDAGEPRNRSSAHAHNILGHEGINPLDLVAKGRAEAEAYGVRFIDDSVVRAVAPAQGTIPAEAALRPQPDDPDALVEAISPSQPQAPDSPNAPAEAVLPPQPDSPAAPAGDHGNSTAARAEFSLETSTGTRVDAQHVILATGVTDELPDIPGLAEGWGETVLHCPYCHGYEVRGQRIGIIGTTALSYHQAMMFSQLSDHVSFIRHEAPAPTEEQSATLAALGVELVDARVRTVSRRGSTTEMVLDGTTEPVFERTTEPVLDGTASVPMTTGVTTSAATESAARVDFEALDLDALDFDALVVGPFFRANGEVFTQLGGTVVEDPSGMGSSIPTDPTGRTEIPGVWAVGNIADMSAMLGASAASGVRTGAMINYELIQSRLNG